MVSPQTLSDSDRRIVARWAAACAARVVPLFEAEASAQDEIRDALDRTRAYSEGRSSAAEEIARRFIAVKAAKAAVSPAGAAAARAVAQASAVAHMGAHALGAAAYAVKAVSLANAGRPEKVDEEIRWQIADLREGERVALRLLPPLGEDAAGPLAGGLLSRGVLGSTIIRIQRQIA
ncbi:putative immunity protein [Corynebacterium pacaense]|uniref:putative immunity protein n=1 Tax=Corynebacterium pacaense TaxID=1816684 RepID=UPI0015C4637F|nr:hypothetical protein [Corynebacterium pacaense]